MPLPPASDDGRDDESADSSDRSSSPAQANTAESQRALADAETLDFHKMEDFIETQLVRGMKLWAGGIGLIVSLRVPTLAASHRVQQEIKEREEADI